MDDEDEDDQDSWASQVALSCGATLRCRSTQLCSLLRVENDLSPWKLEGCRVDLPSRTSIIHP